MDEKNKQDSDDRTVVSLAMLSAVTDDVKQHLARGIMSLIVSYINGNVSIDAVLGACSVCCSYCNSVWNLDLGFMGFLITSIVEK